MVDLATIAIDVSVPNAVAAKAQIDALGPAGEVSAARVKAAFGGIAQQAASSATATVAAFVDRAKHELATEQAGLREALARGFITDKEAAAAAMRAVQIYNATVLNAVDIGSKAGAFEGAAGQAAYAGIIGSLQKLDGGAKTAHLSLGRLSTEVATFMARLTGANSMVTRFTAQLGGMVAGALPMIGIMVAIAAASAVWNKMTEGARRAREEQERLTKALSDWYDKLRASPSSEYIKWVNAQIEANQKLRRELEGKNPWATVKENFSAALASMSGDIRTAAARFAEHWANYTRMQVAAIERGNAAIRAAALAGYEAALLASRGIAAEKGQNLASLISGGAATAQQSRDATALLKSESDALKQMQRDYAGYSAKRAEALKAAGTAFLDSDKNRFKRDADEAQKLMDVSLASQARAFGTIKTIRDGMKSATDGMIKVGNSATKTLLDQMREIENAHAEYQRTLAATFALSQKQIDSIEREDEALQEAEQIANKMAREREHEVQLMGKVGAEREMLIARQKAENEQAEMNGKYRGRALELVTQEIQRSYELQRVIIARAEAQRVENERIQFHNSLYEEVARIGARNAKIAAEDVQRMADDALGDEKQRQYAQDMRQIWTEGLSRILTDGTRSWEDFFENVLRLFEHAMSEMAKRAAELKIGSMPGQNLLGYAIGGIQGGLAGYQIGQSTGSSLGGFFGGAISGAMAGSAFGLPGTIIGGLVGAVSGLFGASAAQKQAAAEQQKAAQQLRINVAQWSAQAGTTTPLAATIASLHQQANALYDAADAALPGRKNEAERERLMRQIRSDEAVLVQKAIEADKNEQKQRQLSLDAREKYAQGLTEEGDAIVRQAAKENELAQARASNWSAEQIARITAIQALEDEKIAADKLKAAADAAKQAAEDAAALAEKNQRAQEDYQVRYLRAMGRGDEADLMAELLDQQREYAQTIKDGLDDATRAALTLALTAERAAAAAEKEKTARRGLEDLTVRALAAQGKTADAEQKRFELEQQRELEDAAGKSAAYQEQLADVLKLEAEQRAQQLRDAAASKFVPVDEYHKTSIGTVTGISAAQADGLLGRADTTNLHLAAIEDMLRRAIFTGEGLSRSNGFGGNTLILQISNTELDDIASASPAVQTLLDRVNGRGLTRARAGAGATRP